MEYLLKMWLLFYDFWQWWFLQVRGKGDWLKMSAFYDWQCTHRQTAQQSSKHIVILYHEKLQMTRSLRASQCWLRVWNNAQTRRHKFFEFSFSLSLSLSLYIYIHIYIGPENNPKARWQQPRLTKASHMMQHATIVKTNTNKHACLITDMRHVTDFLL